MNSNNPEPRLAAESNQSISQTAKDLGIKKTTLYGWVDKYHPKDNIEKEDKESLNHELKLLRKENLKLKQERDILKKAAAYFAGEMVKSTPGFMLTPLN